MASRGRPQLPRLAKETKLLKIISNLKDFASGTAAQPGDHTMGGGGVRVALSTDAYIYIYLAAAAYTAAVACVTEAI